MAEEFQPSVTSLPETSSPGLAPKSGFASRHRAVIAKSALIGVVFIGLAAAGIYYYYSHLPYTESEIIALIRTNILPSVVRIDCAEYDGGPEESGGTGLYFLDKDGKPWVETNAHVMLASDGKFHGCNVYFPQAGNGAFYDSSYIAGIPTLYSNLESSVNISGGFLSGNNQTVLGLDYAVFPLTGANTDQQGVQYPYPPLQADAYAGFEKICKYARNAEIGDKIYILGYPNVGGGSLTLTDGVVSGFGGNLNEWIKVSAVVNGGSSGGVAIGAENGCNYGIPTKASFESGGNLGLVLRSGYISDFVAGLTGKTAYAPPTEETDMQTHLTQFYEFPDFGIGYPDQWEFATTTPAEDNSYAVHFISPSEGALDEFQESMSVIAIPDAPEDSFDALVEEVKQGIDPKDPYASKAKYVNLYGVNTYQIINLDESFRSYSVPVLEYRIIFWRNGTLYDLYSVAEDGPNESIFLTLFATMGDSIEFKN